MTRTETGPGRGDLEQVIGRCRELIETRFPARSERGAAAVLLSDGVILTGTSPDVVNAALSVCHEMEPYCAAYRLDRRILASVCLHRDETGRFLVLSPCGICREWLASHGPEVLAAVPRGAGGTEVRWAPLRELLPHYWATAFRGELPAWEAQREAEERRA